MDSFNHWVGYLPRGGYISSYRPGAGDERATRSAGRSGCRVTVGLAVVACSARVLPENVALPGSHKFPNILRLHVERASRGLPPTRALGVNCFYSVWAR